MQETKFRVWEPRHSVMVYPDTIQIVEGKVDKLWGQGWKFSSDSEPDMVLMQFTGLLDKNGKEIYEGDIVKHENDSEIGEVTFKLGSFGTSIGFAEAENEHSDSITGWEVLGHIYA